MPSGTIITTRANDLDVVTYHDQERDASWSAILTVTPEVIAAFREPWQIIPYTKPVAKHTTNDLLTLIDVATDGLLASETKVLYALPPKTKSRRNDQYALSSHGWKRTRKHIFPDVTSGVWEKHMQSDEAAKAAQHLFDIHRWKTDIQPIPITHAETL